VETNTLHPPAATFLRRNGSSNVTLSHWIRSPPKAGR